MHATVLSVKITDPSADPERKGLHEVVIPGVKSQPGFVAGYWLAMPRNEGHAIVLYDTEESARSALSRDGIEPGATPVPGVVVDSVEVGEVIGQA